MHPFLLEKPSGNKQMWSKLCHFASADYFWYTRCPIKMYLTLMHNFKALNILMSGTLGFPVSLDLYILFDTLLICFHGLLAI